VGWRVGQRAGRGGLLAAATGLGLLGAGLTGVAADPIDRTAPPVLRAVPATAGLGAELDPAAVTEALRPLLAGGALGPGRTPAHVVDVASGEVLLAQADRPTVPASTTKIVTAVSVLDALGADATLSTRTVILNPAAEVPRVVLVGAGDPSLRSSGVRVGGAGTSLTPASLGELADATARALDRRGVGEVRVGFDDSAFTGPAMHPTWARSFPSAGIVAPVSALQVDQGRRTPKGRARVADPATRAAGVFADRLEAAGVEVRGRLKQVRPDADSVALASVASPTIGVLVERMLATSDNDYAEALGRLGAAGGGEEASFEGVGARAEAVLAELDLADPRDRFADASGLSRANALTPSTLTGLLRATPERFGIVSSGLAVAGATGSLRSRYDSAASQPGRGVVRAKTGTLTGVTGLAGYASRPDGRLLSFAILDDSVPGGGFAARAAVDRAVAALVACECVAASPAEP
jgi:D-alanyl-D-alanine carboxypeptidase/D-alanyl-D-alanine-endopeptidase (penicillin-binding protein 4)